jgi:hypothetical protein
MNLIPPQKNSVAISQSPVTPGQALSAPSSRQILRIFLQSDQPMSSTEIAGHSLAPCSTPCTAFYMRTLSDAQLIVRRGAVVGNGMVRHFFSVVPLASWMQNLLAETECLDRASTGRLPSPSPYVNMDDGSRL